MKGVNFATDTNVGRIRAMTDNAAIFDLCKAVCNIGRYLVWQVLDDFDPCYLRINAVTIYEGGIRYVTSDIEPFLDHPNIKGIVDEPPEEGET